MIDADLVALTARVASLEAEIAELKQALEAFPAQLAQAFEEGLKSE